jgi:hypothetical protein
LGLFLAAGAVAGSSSLSDSSSDPLATSDWNLSDGLPRSFFFIRRRSCLQQEIMKHNADIVNMRVILPLHMCHKRLVLRRYMLLHCLDTYLLS